MTTLAIPFGATSTAMEVIAGVDLTGKRAIVTGASSGIGVGVTGTYFEDCQPAAPCKPGVRRGVARYALDPENAERLWAMSLELIRRGARRSELHPEH
jgi:hypothetical protein